MAQTPEEVMRARFERAIARTVRSLRDMADQIEREAAHNIENAIKKTFEWNTYGYAAAAAVKTLTWGVANSNIDSVVMQAADADAARDGHAS